MHRTRWRRTGIVGLLRTQRNCTVTYGYHALHQDWVDTIWFRWPFFETVLVVRCGGKNESINRMKSVWCVYIGTVLMAERMIGERLGDAGIFNVLTEPKWITFCWTLWKWFEKIVHLDNVFPFVYDIKSYIMNKTKTSICTNINKTSNYMFRVIDFFILLNAYFVNVIVN